MVDQTLLPAIEQTISQNEIGDASPYCLSFARLGASGASFGLMQGDTNASQLARDTLRQVLSAAAVDQPTIDRILASVSVPLPSGNPLSASDTAVANDALASIPGRALVDAMDQELLSGVLQGLDSCVAAAATRNMTLAPLAYLYAAPWINMSGAPTSLIVWLKGGAVRGVPSPSPPIASGADMVAYLQATAYFQANPRNFVHLQQCVQKGAALLPQS